MKKNHLFKISLIIFVVIFTIFPVFSNAQQSPSGWPDASEFDVQNNPADNEIDNVSADNFGNSGGGGNIFCNLASDPKFDTLVNYITCMITSAVVPLLFTLAFALFVWGVVQYVLNDTEEAKRAKGKQFMIWGIIALTVMFSVWGIVAIFGETFGINTKLIPQVAD